MTEARPPRWLRALVAGAVGLAGSVEAARAPCDAALLHGQIHTPTGFAEALAIKDGRLLAVGSDKAIAALGCAPTRRIDLHGRTVFPGLHDMHVHPLMAGIAARRCRIAQGANGAQLIESLRACVAAKAPGEWVTGGQWEAASLGGTALTRQSLDAVSPANPVVLVDVSAHSWWANSRALAVAGIGRETKDPPGGIIERDAAGEPTGVLRESAGRLLMSRVPAPSAQESVDALHDALSTLLSYGVTSLTDALVTVPALEAYDALADRHLLVQRVLGCLVYGRDSGAPGGFERMLKTRASYARARFSPECVKIFMDGVPTDSHTAAMLEPYAPAPDGRVRAPERGLLLLEPAELNPLVARLDRLGISIKFHAVGDAASRSALDAIGAARAANGSEGPRHVVGHLTFIARADLARAKSMRATLEFSPYLWFPAPINDDIIQAVGPARIERVWPVREGIDSGALVIAGSDWSVVPSANPWIGIETLVTRRKPGGGGPAYGPAEAITLVEALRLFTANAAEQRGLGSDLGTIERGKLADLIVLDRNPFKIPIVEVHEVKVLEAYIAGERVFSAAAGANAK